MKWSLHLVWISLVCCMSAHAMQLPPLLELNGDGRDIRLPITNNSKIAQVYRVNTEETSFPDQNWKAITPAVRRLMVSPAQLRLAAGQQGYFKIHYLSVRDNQERYFRLAVEEQGQEERPASAGISANFPLQVIANLIVRPLQPALDYVLENGRLRNTGNGYLLLLQDEDCGKEKGLTAFVPPGRSYTLPAEHGKSVLSVGMVDQLKVVRSQCSTR